MDDDKTLANLQVANSGETAVRTPVKTAGSPLRVLPRQQRFFGNYIGQLSVVRKIAEGGMGVVYEAIQTNLSRTVALKILMKNWPRARNFCNGSNERPKQPPR